MRFEVSERITTTADKKDLVIKLTEQFNKISRAVIINDGVIEVKGIEASWGSINRSDTTRITINQCDGGYLLVADVHYRPSVALWIFFIILLFTYILWIMPIIFYIIQKNTVRNAIEHVFKRVANEYSRTGHNTELSLDDLERLAALKEKGILTEDEFNQKKKEILKTPLSGSTQVISGDHSVNEDKKESEKISPALQTKLKISLKDPGYLMGVKGIDVILDGYKICTMQFGEIREFDIAVGAHIINLMLRAMFKRSSNNLQITAKENGIVHIIGDYSRAWGYVKITQVE